MMPQRAFERLLFNTFRQIVVRDPRDEQPQPIIFRLDDRHPDPRRTVIRSTDPRDLRLYLDRHSVRPMLTDVESVTLGDLLVELEKRPERRYVIGLSRLAPRSSILGATRHDYRQPEGHPECESFFLKARLHTRQHLR